VHLARTGSPAGIIPGPPCRAGYEDSTFGTETIISSIASDDAVETHGDVVESRNGGHGSDQPTSAWVVVCFFL
jgi:hypothetical protein